jgi:PKD repeat protein
MKTYQIYSIKYFLGLAILFSSIIFFTNCSRENDFHDFEGEPTSGKAPLTVKFTDKSNANIVEWKWTFSGGEPEEAKGKGPHTVKYKKPGEYDVTSKIMYYNGMDSILHPNEVTKEKFIKVKAD